MSKNVLSLLIVVCALFTGACAGRQIHTGMPGTTSFQVPVQMPDEGPKPETAIVSQVQAPDLTDAELRQKVQDEIQTYVHGLIDEANAANRAAAEKMHRTYVPPSLPNNDELVAALSIDYDSFRRISDEADRQFYASVKDIVDQAYAREREEREMIARAERRHRSAARRQIAMAVTAEAPQSQTVLAATAAPEPVPPVMPQVAATVATPSTTTDPAVRTQPLSLFTPDASTVAKSDEYLSINLIGAGFAAVLGILLGILLARRRPRDIDDPLYTQNDEFNDVPDGTLLVREIRGGKVSTTYRLMADLQLRKSLPKSASADDAERNFFDTDPSDDIDLHLSSSFAAIVAKDEDTHVDAAPVSPPMTAPEPPQPETIAAIVAIEPSPPAETVTPPEPPPVLAAGTRDISSGGKANHGVAGEIDLTHKDIGRVVDKPTHSIVYEERPTEPSKDPTAASN